MTAQDEGPLGLAAQRRPGVPGGVEVVFHRQLRQLGLKPGSRLEPGFGPGNALRPVIIRGERTKLLQIGNGSAWVYWHRIPRITRRRIRSTDLVVNPGKIPRSRIWRQAGDTMGHAASRKPTGSAHAGQESRRNTCR